MALLVLIGKFENSWQRHCGYHRYYNQRLSHQCALVVAVSGGPLTLVNQICTPTISFDTLVTGMGGATCIANLPSISLLASSVGNELLSSSARITSVESAKGLLVSDIQTHRSDPRYTWVRQKFCRIFSGELRLKVPSLESIASLKLLQRCGKIITGIHLNIFDPSRQL